MEEPKTWDAAQVACEQEGGNLASVDMSYDQAFVAGVVLQGKADAWIGLRRKVLAQSSLLNWTGINHNKDNLKLSFLWLW